MRSCDTCPGTTDCAGINLHPILLQVHGLYADGVTDKFDILFSLDEASETLLERYDDQVSKACWTKAALLAIADIITAAKDQDKDQDTNTLISTAVAAFERFPWQITELLEQAADLYQAIVERDPESPFATTLSKREFVKICKAIAYPHKT